MSIIDPAELELFAGVGRKELAQIEALCTPLHIAAGSVVTRQGTFGHECVVIVEGAVEVKRSGEVIATAGPGEMVGELSLLEGRHAKRTATAHAVTDCRLLVFSTTDFDRLIREHPTIAARIRTTAVHRLTADLDPS